MKLLEMINVFGIPFTFTVFHQKKYKTMLGVFFSLLSLVLVIVFSFLFGQDFFFHQNPKAIYSKIIPTEYTYINMTSDMLILPWRISNPQLEKVDFDGFIYPIIYYHRYFKDPDTNELLEHKVVQLTYSECKPNANFTNIEIVNYYCFDLEGIKLGGNWEGYEYSYITFYLSFCPNGSSFGSNENCTKENIDKLNTILNCDNPFIFVLVYPIHYFQPKTIDSPILQNYKIYTHVLNLQLMREDTYTFQKVEMVDDQGLIFPEKKKTSVISLDEKDSVFYFSNYESLMTENASSVFYILNINFGKNYDEYSRSYMKFQEVIANIGGFVRVVMILFDVFCCSINEIFMTASLISQFFLIEKAIKKNNTNPLIKFSRFGLNISGSINNIIHLVNNNADKTTAQLNNSKISLELNNANNITKFNSSNKSENEFVKIVKAKRAPDKKAISRSCFNLIKYHWFSSGFTSQEDKEKAKVNGYSIAFKALHSRIEVLNYIQMVNEFELLKTLLLNKHQIISLNYMSKMNVFNMEALGKVYQEMRPLEEEGKNLKSLKSYFTEIKMLNTSFEKDYDMKLFQYLDPNIQNLL